MTESNVKKLSLFSKAPATAQYYQKKSGGVPADDEFLHQRTAYKMENAFRIVVFLAEETTERRQVPLRDVQK